MSSLKVCALPLAVSPSGKWRYRSAVYRQNGLSALERLKNSWRQSTGKISTSFNHVFKNQGECAHRIVTGSVPKFWPINNHCKSSPYYFSLNTIIRHCAKNGFLRIESRASRKLVEVPSEQPRINQHPSALLRCSRAMHLDPAAVTHIPSGATALGSVVVTSSDTNDGFLNLSWVILYGVWNTGKCYILFLSLGLEQIFIHNVPGSWMGFWAAVQLESKLRVL